MSTTVRNTAHDHPFRDNPFVLAVAVMRERVDRLSEEDKSDLYELLPALFRGSEEERASALRAANEIIDQTSGKIQRMELPAVPGPALEKWIEFVSRRIREARTGANLTQEELAERSGIPQPHISRLESGQHSPTAKTLEKIAAALQLPPEYFDPTA